MTRAAETLVDTLSIRQTLSWQAGDWLPLLDHVPEEVVRSATTVTESEIEETDRETVVQFDLAGCRRERIHVGYSGDTLFVWVAEESGIVKQRCVKLMRPFEAGSVQAQMSYGVLTIRVPLRRSDESGLHRRRFG